MLVTLRWLINSSPVSRLDGRDGERNASRPTRQTPKPAKPDPLSDPDLSTSNSGGGRARHPRGVAARRRGVVVVSPPKEKTTKDDDDGSGGPGFPADAPGAARERHHEARAEAIGPVTWMGPIFGACCSLPPVSAADRSEPGLPTSDKWFRAGVSETAWLFCFRFSRLVRCFSFSFMCVQCF